MEALLFLYKSSLPTEQVLDLFKSRTGKYRNVPGLVQKLYIHDESSGHVGGIYIFDTKENLEAFQISDLARGIEKTYKFIEPASQRVFRITNVLYERDHSL